MVEAIVRPPSSSKSRCARSRPGKSGPAGPSRGGRTAGPRAGSRPPRTRPARRRRAGPPRSGPRPRRRRRPGASPGRGMRHAGERELERREPRGHAGERLGDPGDRRRVHLAQEPEGEVLGRVAGRAPRNGRGARNLDRDEPSHPDRPYDAASAGGSSGLRPRTVGRGPDQRPDLGLGGPRSLRLQDGSYPTGAPRVPDEEDDRRPRSRAFESPRRTRSGRSAPETSASMWTSRPPNARQAHVDRRASTARAIPRGPPRKATAGRSESRASGRRVSKRPWRTNSMRSPCRARIRNAPISSALCSSPSRGAPLGIKSPRRRAPATVRAKCPSVSSTHPRRTSPGRPTSSSLGVSDPGPRPSRGRSGRAGR